MGLVVDLQLKMEGLPNLEVFRLGPVAIVRKFEGCVQGMAAPVQPLSWTYSVTACKGEICFESALQFSSFLRISCDDPRRAALCVEPVERCLPYLRYPLWSRQSESGQ